MKLLKVEYQGLAEGLWTRLKATIELDGVERTGFLDFEYDGRDMDVVGEEFEPHSDAIIGGLEDIYEDDEAIAKLEAELEKGAEEAAKKLEERN